MKIWSVKMQFAIAPKTRKKPAENSYAKKVGRVVIEVAVTAAWKNSHIKLNSTCHI